MKSPIKVCLALVFVFFCLSGCTGSPKPVSNPYSFADDASYTASMTIGGGVRLVDFEGAELPESADGKMWTSIILPADRSMDLRVYIFWEGNSPGSRRRGIFKCPPLEAGEEYNLRFDIKTRGVFIDRPVGNGAIVLEKKRETSGLFRSRTEYELVYRQEIPPLPK